jgi:hypothetical protein
MMSKLYPEIQEKFRVFIKQRYVEIVERQNLKIKEFINSNPLPLFSPWYCVCDRTNQYNGKAADQWIYDPTIEELKEMSRE